MNLHLLRLRKLSRVAINVVQNIDRVSLKIKVLMDGSRRILYLYEYLAKAS